jgi:hypothetical protein
MYAYGPHTAAQAATMPTPTPDRGGPFLRAAAEVNPPCGCELHHGIDADLDRLRVLVAGGMGQWEASRMLWGPDAAEAVA